METTRNATGGIGYDTELLNDLREAKQKNAMALQWQALQGAENVANIHSKAMTDVANIHWQTQKEDTMAKLSAQKPLWDAQAGLVTQEANAASIKNDLSKQFGARAMEANIAGQETANKRADFTYGLEQQFAPQKYQNELDLQTAGRNKIINETNDSNIAADLQANNAAMQQAKDYQTKVTNTLGSNSKTIADNNQFTGLGLWDVLKMNNAEQAGVAKRVQDLTGTTPSKIPFFRNIINYRNLKKAQDVAANQTANSEDLLSTLRTAGYPTVQ